jgi:hypothetical protein
VQVKVSEFDALPLVRFLWVANRQLERSSFIDGQLGALNAAEFLNTPQHLRVPSAVV